jgi:beta-glucosidase
MVPAIVMAWYPGQAGGTALGQLLFGTANFSGKLPMTWPAAVADLGTFSTPPTTVMPYYHGYRAFDTQNKQPLYPFGHGLSYTTFSYANLQVPCTTVTTKGVVNVMVDVTNTGSRAGDETVLLFVSWPSSTVGTRKAAGYKELKGFKRQTFAPGETKRVQIPLRVSDLDYYDTSSGSWKIESGRVNVMVGRSSRDPMMLMDSFTVQ